MDKQQQQQQQQRKVLYNTEKPSFPQNSPYYTVYKHYITDEEGSTMDCVIYCVARITTGDSIRFDNL